VPINKGIASRPTRAAPRWQTFPWPLAAPRLPLHVGPDFAAGCPSCSSIADGFNGSAVHLANHDVMLWAVSRAPMRTAGVQASDGWTFPWASSVGGDFNFDFCASYTGANKAQAASNTTTGARRHSGHADEKGPRSRAQRPMGLRRSRLCAERTRRRTFARGRA